MSQLRQRPIRVARMAQNAFGLKPDKAPRTKAIVLYDPSKSCILRKAAKPNKAVAATPAAARAVETTTCNWRTLLCVKPCSPDCSCLYPRPCPPPESWPSYIFRNVLFAAKLSAAGAMIKASADAGVWGFLDDTMKLRERLARELSAFFWVIAPDKRSDEQRYEMARFRYNWKSAYNFFVMKVARDLAYGPGFLAEIVVEQLMNFFGLRVEDKGDGYEGGEEAEEEEPIVCPKEKKQKKSTAQEDTCSRIDRLSFSLN